MFLHWTGSVGANPDWQQKSTIATVVDIEWFDGTYIAVGSAGEIWSSTDRITWNLNSQNFTYPFLGVTHNGTKFYAAYINTADSALYVIQSSNNGISWSQAFKTADGYAPVGNTFGGIASDGAGTTWTIGGNSLLPIISETTITDWQAGSPNTLSTPSSTIVGVTYVGGYQVFLGVGRIWRDGTNIDYTNDTPRAAYDIAHKPGTTDFVLVGEHDSDDSGIFKSTNNMTSWTAATAPDGIYKSVTYGSGKYLAVVSTQDTIISTDGATFTNLGFTGTDAVLNTVKYINNEFIAVGNGIWSLYADQ